MPRWTPTHGPHDPKLLYEWNRIQIPDSNFYYTRHWRLMFQSKFFRPSSLARERCQQVCCTSAWSWSNLLSWKKIKNRNPSQTTVAMSQVLETTATNSQHPSPFGQISQVIVALRSLQFRYLPQCVFRVRDLTSLAVVLSSMAVDNDYQRNCDDLKTTRDDNARHGNVKEMRVAVSNEIWTESQRIVLPSQNFQHAENLPTDATDNFGLLRSLPD